MTAPFEVVPLGGYIGALIQGVDLREPLDDAAIECFRDAVFTHHVVFVRDQDLSDDQQFEFAARFGTVSSESATNATGANRLSFIEDTEANPPHTDQWHSDMTCWERPPALAFLSARAIPAFGGDTIWVDLCGVYEALSPTMRAFVEPLHVRHFVGPRFRDAVAQVLAAGGAGPNRLAANTGGDRAVIRAELDERYTGVEATHPLVRTHPVTGRQALFLSPRFTKSIVELTAEESAALLAHLETHLDDPNFQVRWRWRANDLAVWDEATTNHRALVDHFRAGPQYRLMRRCTVEGDAPFHRATAAA